MLYMLTALHSGRMPECRAVFKSVHIKKSGIYAASKVFYEDSSKTYRKCVWHKRVAYMPQLMLFAWNISKPTNSYAEQKRAAYMPQIKANLHKHPQLENFLH